jgi:hypothetical protein
MVDSCARVVTAITMTGGPFVRSSPRWPPKWSQSTLRAADHTIVPYPTAQVGGLSVPTSFDLERTPAMPDRRASLAVALNLFWICSRFILVRP